MLTYFQNYIIPKYILKDYILLDDDTKIHNLMQKYRINQFKISYFYNEYDFSLYYVLFNIKKNQLYCYNYHLLKTQTYFIDSKMIFYEIEKDVSNQIYKTVFINLNNKYTIFYSLYKQYIKYKDNISYTYDSNWKLYVINETLDGFDKNHFNFYYKTTLKYKNNLIIYETDKYYKNKIYSVSGFKLFIFEVM